MTPPDPRQLGVYVPGSIALAGTLLSSRTNRPPTFEPVGEAVGGVVGDEIPRHRAAVPGAGPSRFIWVTAIAVLYLAISANVLQFVRWGSGLRVVQGGSRYVPRAFPCVPRAGVGAGPVLVQVPAGRKCVL